MKLAELLKIAKGSIELHSSMDGRLIASNPKSLEKFKDVEVFGMYPKIRINGDKDFAVPYLYVFGNSSDIYRIRNVLRGK